MSFASLEYLFFLSAVTVLYWICSNKARPVLLLTASYMFYMGWSVPFAFLLLGETALCYFSCILLEKRKSKPLFVLLLFLAFLPLVFFKYAGFLLGWMGESTRTFLNSIVLPVGISFYTFQAVSCVIDVYRGGRKAEKDFLRFSLFVSFFPQLVAGPIERADHLLPQLAGRKRFQWEDIQAGGRLMLCGYFRKICIADFLAPYVDGLYSRQGPDGFAAVLGALLFGLQIYNDFAGYSEIALGSARMLGICLTRNFHEPYLARSLQDFWRRWHITLNQWFRSYVYLPLGGKHRRILAAGAVFFLSGLWHGANGTFICWGIYHGLLYGLDRAFHNRKWRIPAWASVVLTFIAVTMGWIFFRAENLEHALSLYKSLFSPWNELEVWREMKMSPSVLLHLAAVLVTAFLVGRWCFQEKTEWMNIDRTVSALLILAIALCWISNLQSGGANAFIYFQF